MATSDGSDAPAEAPLEPPKPAMKLISNNRSFDGWQSVYEHYSEVLKCSMKFAIYLPPGTREAELLKEKFPVLYWLSGLTCTEQNFITKAGAQQHAARRDIILVAPDTSPRGCGIEGEDDAYDFGTGAGFYVDATEDKWKTNYNMYSYVTKELPALINENFPALPDKQSIFGHSMGGHGALVCALRNPGKYCSVSAFAPICNPINCSWGQKAFTGYLGPDREAWKQYDATELVKKFKGPPISYVLIDQGKADQFRVDGQLLAENFMEGCRQGNVPVLLRTHDGYDHSYYFIASFMEDHIRHHVAALLGEEEEEEEREGEKEEEEEGVEVVGGGAKKRAAPRVKKGKWAPPKPKAEATLVTIEEEGGGAREKAAVEAKEEKEDGAEKAAIEEEEGGGAEKAAVVTKEEEEGGAATIPTTEQKEGGAGEKAAKEEEQGGGAGEKATIPTKEEETEGEIGETAAVTKEEEEGGGAGEKAPVVTKEEEGGGAGEDSQN